MPAWNPEWNTMLIPTREELDEPDRWVDALVDFIRRRRERGLDRWAVEALAGGLGVPVAVDPDDPITRAEQHAALLLISLREAARSRPDLPSELTQQIVWPHVEELHALVQEWRDESRQGGGRDWTGEPWAL